VSTAFINELPAHFFDVPVLWIHGHTHTSFDYRVGNCRVLCNPRGYQAAGRPLPENAAFNPGLVVQVEPAQVVKSSGCQTPGSFKEQEHGQT